MVAGAFAGRVEVLALVAVVAVVVLAGVPAVLRLPVASRVAVVAFRTAASYHGGRSTVVEPTLV